MSTNFYLPESYERTDILKFVLEQNNLLSLYQTVKEVHEYLDTELEIVSCELRIDELNLNSETDTFRVDRARILSEQNRLTSLKAKRTKIIYRETIASRDLCSRILDRVESLVNELDESAAKYFREHSSDKLVAAAVAESLSEETQTFGALVKSDNYINAMKIDPKVLFVDHVLLEHKNGSDG